MKVFLFVLVSLFSVNFTHAQGDRLGLDMASQQMAAKIPVAVAAAIEASSVPGQLPGIINSYFGYGSGRRFEYYPTTQLGNELQPRIGDLMLQLGYANITPATGFQGYSTGDIAAETEIKRVLPKYVVVPTISFESIGSKGQQINLGIIGPLVGPSVNNRVGRVAVNEASRSSINTGNQKVKATFALRFYDQSGTQILIEEACPQEISVDEFNLLKVGLTYGKEVRDVTTLKPLAVKLTMAMTARLIERGTCN